MVLCSNEAQGCYDCIVLLIAALCRCCLGVSKPSVLSMMLTLQGMQHHTCTAHGHSQWYTRQSTWAAPVAGIRQGNRAGLAIWAAVSSPLLEIMKEDGFLAMVSCTMSSHKKSIGGLAFVDNTNLCVSGQLTLEMMVSQMQQLVTQWEGLLRSTGGALVPDKCFWYLIKQVWMEGKWQYQKLNYTVAHLQVRDQKGNMNLIPRLEEASEA